MFIVIGLLHLIYYRPVYDLICGASSIREKILRAYPVAKYSLHCRSYLETFVKIQNPGIDINKINDDKYLFINGRILASANLADLIPIEGEDRLYKSNNYIVAARVSGKNLEKIKKRSDDLLSDLVLMDCLRKK